MMDSEKIECLRLALEICEDNINPDIKYPFFNHNKFDINKLQKYISGFEQLETKTQLNKFMTTMLYIYSDKEENVLKPYIKCIYQTYMPFKHMVNKWTYSCVTAFNIKKNLYNLNIICNDNVIIFGQIIDRVANDNCSLDDFEFIDIVCQNREAYEEMKTTITSKYEVFVSNHNNIIIIMIKGIPRILRIYFKNNCMQFIHELSNPFLLDMLE